MTPPRVSVVLPAKDEEGAIAAVVRGIAEALAGVPHEILVVDDGSADATAAAVAALMPGSADLRLLRHERPLGQSAAIRTGVLAARAAVVGTLDADGQNPPAELPRVLAPFLDGPFDPRLGLVQGQRARRQDPAARRLASRAANGLRAALLGDGARDSACGLKAFPRDAYLRLPYFDHIHRFMPAMIRREGYRVEFVEVDHAPRRSGASKYGNLGRALVGAVDLAGAAWLMRRRRLGGAWEVPGDEVLAPPPRPEGPWVEWPRAAPEGPVPELLVMPRLSQEPEGDAAQRDARQRRHEGHVEREHDDGEGKQGRGGRRREEPFRDGV